MKKFLLGAIALMLFACTGDDDNGAEDNNGSDNFFTGNVYLKTQADVNAFAAQKYSRIYGNVFIGGYDANSNISDLLGLSGLTMVEGYLVVSDIDGLTSLHGLEKLESVANLQIENTGLQTIEHLQSLKTANVIAITGNENLVSLKGLEHIESPESLAISGNPGLTSLEGLSGLKNTPYLLVSDNPALVSFDGLESIAVIKKLSVYRNSSLTSLESLSDLQELNEFSCMDNTVLTVLPFLKDIREMNSLTLIGNNVSNLQAFKNIAKILYLRLENLPIASLDGLLNLKTCYTLTVDHCASLTSFNGLTSLRSISYGGLYVSHCSQLTTLAGLEDVDINVFAFESNSGLTDYCAVQQDIQTSASFVVNNNAYNPTLDDIIAGNCSQ